MGDIGREMLLDTLGWGAASAREPLMLWSASAGGRSALRLSLSQGPSFARLLLESPAPEGAPSSADRELLLVEFAALPNGRMSLSKHRRAGAEQPLGAGAQPRALEDACLAKRLMAACAPAEGAAR